MATEASANSDVTLKFLVIGDAEVGKSSLVRRYVDNTFTNNYTATLGVEFKTKTLHKPWRGRRTDTTTKNRTDKMIGTGGPSEEHEVDKRTDEQRRVNIQLWDTVGIERFRTIVSSYYRGAHGVILVYDVTNQKSFDTLTSRMKEVMMYGGEGVKVIVVGNKCDEDGGSSGGGGGGGVGGGSGGDGSGGGSGDRVRIVGREDGQLRAERLGVQFFETSARDGNNVRRVFETLVKELIQGPR